MFIRKDCSLKYRFYRFIWSMSNKCARWAGYRMMKVYSKDVQKYFDSIE